MKECTVCTTRETKQWYTGPICKSCYRKQHRLNNADRYKEKDSNNYKNNKEYIKNRQNIYYENNKEKCKERSRIHRQISGDQRRPGSLKEWKSKNLDKTRGYTAKYKLRNPEKVKHSQDKFVKNNLEIYKYRSAKRRAVKLKATPKWLSSEQFEEIKHMYMNCPPGYHVDHIVPLQGENVRGLHVPWNLQYLPAIDNLKKSNKI